LGVKIPKAGVPWEEEERSLGGCSFTSSGLQMVGRKKPGMGRPPVTQRDPSRVTARFYTDGKDEAGIDRGDSETWRTKDTTVYKGEIAGQTKIPAGRWTDKYCPTNKKGNEPEKGTDSSIQGSGGTQA